MIIGLRHKNGKSQLENNERVKKISMAGSICSNLGHLIDVTLYWWQCPFKFTRCVQEQSAVSIFLGRGGGGGRRGFVSSTKNTEKAISDDFHFYRPARQQLCWQLFHLQPAHIHGPLLFASWRECATLLRISSEAVQVRKRQKNLRIAVSRTSRSRWERFSTYWSRLKRAKPLMTEGSRIQKKNGLHRRSHRYCRHRRWGWSLNLRQGPCLSPWYICWYHFRHPSRRSWAGKEECQMGTQTAFAGANGLESGDFGGLH